ncbi:O-acetyl-ADP-ribose deacetylase [Pantoea sp. B65]|uniref:O-acetyl-ADP-ribose deacetylase n=1 Tax=Pantoea sp. B65 TaxID=2813359 RepID=UPI0039B54378
MKHRIRVIHGDITRLQVGAIVNAANNALLGGGGVDGAIHRAAGPQLLAACREVVARQGECQTGQAVITAAGKLSAQAVIHTVGPVWHGGGQGEAALLASAYRHSLLLAEEHLLSTIAFPSISTGVYGYPKQLAAQVAFATVSEFLSQHQQPQQVYFVCFDEQTFALYQKQLAQWQQGMGEDTD